MKPDPTRNERQRRWYWNHREHKNALTRACYWRLRNAGLCPQCGREPVPGLVLCAACRAKRNHATAVVRQALEEIGRIE